MIIGSLLELLSIAAVPIFINLIAYTAKSMEEPIINSVVTYLNISDKTELILWGGLALLATYLIKNGY